MKVRILAAVIAAAALPVLAQTSSAPVENRQATLEVQHPAKPDPKAAKATKAKPAKVAKSVHKNRKAKKKARHKHATAG